VDVEYFASGEKREKDYLIYLGRLVPYKRPDIALLAAKELGLPIKFVGDGPELENLQAIGYDGADFLGFLPREQLLEMLSGARALIFPPEEDFGITPLEGTAAGVPVAAYGVGGATETVREGETGSFFMEQTPESAAAAVRRALEIKVDKDAFVSHAMQFNTERFKREIADYINRAWEDFRNGRA
jgi:glycosyltransferase involved in cell wall biosynthesis